MAATAMSRRTWALLLAFCLLLTAGSALALRHHGSSSGPARLEVDPTVIAFSADGVSVARLGVRRSDGAAITPADLRVVILDTRGGKPADSDRLRISLAASVDAVEAALRPGILPGAVQVRFESGTLSPATVRVTLASALDDRFHDGTPDFLRLDSPADRDAFRRWFTEIAEYQALRTDAIPGEINDCAALLRYSYRNALHIHDTAWLQETGMAAIGGASVGK